MTIKREDGTLNVGNIAAIIICFPVLGWFLVFSVTLYQLPDKVDKLAQKVEEVSKQQNRDANDIHIIKQILHIDGNYALSTNSFNVVGQSTYIKNN